jgi:hypothetical protein
VGGGRPERRARIWLKRIQAMAERRRRRKRRRKKRRQPRILPRGLGGLTGVVRWVRCWKSVWVLVGWWVARELIFWFVVSARWETEFEKEGRLRQWSSKIQSFSCLPSVMKVVYVERLKGS